jgi:hypothetical protein
MAGYVRMAANAAALAAATASAPPRPSAETVIMVAHVCPAKPVKLYALPN